MMGNNPSHSVPFNASQVSAQFAGGSRVASGLPRLNLQSHSHPIAVVDAPTEWQAAMAGASGPQHHKESPNKFQEDRQNVAQTLFVHARNEAGHPFPSQSKHENSPLSNESIRFLTQKEQLLNQKYHRRVLEEQLQAQQQFDANLRELEEVRHELSVRHRQGLKNKMIWRSPFVHHQRQKDVHKASLAGKQVENFERVP